MPSCVCLSVPVCLCVLPKKCILRMQLLPKLLFPCVREQLFMNEVKLLRCLLHPSHHLVYIVRTKFSVCVFNKLC